MFIKVKIGDKIQGFPIEDIKRVCSRDSTISKSLIELKGSEIEYYSTEDAETIIDRINQLYENKTTTQG